MTEGIQLNQATIGFLASIGGPLILTIVALFSLVKGRMTRAENQVDTLLPSMATMVDELRGLRELVRALREELAREQGRRS